MSLTGHLDDPTSPVTRFFAERFANLRAIRTSDPIDNAVPREFSISPPSIVPTYGRRHPGTAGAALDYRLRLGFPAFDPADTVAAAGAELLRQHLSPRGTDAQIWSELAHATSDGSSRDRRCAAKDRASRLCVVLAWFEQLYRMGVDSPWWAEHPIVQASAEATALQDLLARIDDGLADDVEALFDLATSQLEQTLTGERVALNPRFARSGDLGGADADLVVDGLLLELKSTQKMSLSRPTVWQVLGYLLADTDDEHSIERVAIYWARHGYLWEMDCEQFLRRLSGTPISLSDARSQFETTLRR